MGFKRRRRYGNPDANQQPIVDFARKRLAASVVVTTVVGGGFADNVVGFHGLTVLVEVKGKDGKLSQSQLDFIRTWRGGPILVVTDGADLYNQLVGLDCRIPPVRGLSDDFKRKVMDAHIARTAAESTATEQGVQHGQTTTRPGGTEG